MDVLRNFLVCGLLSVFLVGCDSSPTYESENCAFFLDRANMFAQLAYEADLAGDTAAYEYYKNAFREISGGLHPVCKQ
jgi:hypothetical protein